MSLNSLGLWVLSASFTATFRIAKACRNADILDSLS